MVGLAAAETCGAATSCGSWMTTGPDGPEPEPADPEPAGSADPADPVLGSADPVLGSIPEPPGSADEPVFRSAGPGWPPIHCCRGV
jgi:hypothetical protein